MTSAMTIWQGAELTMTGKKENRGDHMGQIKEILRRILEQELLAAMGLFHLSNITASEHQKERYRELALEEVEHFLNVSRALKDLGEEPVLDNVSIDLEEDELKALIVLKSLEDTLMRLYEDILTENDQALDPVRKRLEGILKDERGHKEQMDLILEEVKKLKGKKR